LESDTIDSKILSWWQKNVLSNEMRWTIHFSFNLSIEERLMRLLKFLAASWNFGWHSIWNHEGAYTNITINASLKAKKIIFKIHKSKQIY
jgi:hypothetical protein